jgi:CDP-glucose 4,6-dehydratase
MSEPWSGRPVLVTGAGGFVASHLARRLVQLGADVTVVLRDDAPGSHFRRLRLDGAVTVLRGSITDYGLVERALNEHDVDTCFHLAAQAIVGVANRSPLSTFDSNIRGSWNVLEACRSARSVRRVVVASSDKAYGSQPHLPYREDMPLLARHPYDVSKACADMLGQAYAVTYGLPVAVARCANIYGPGDTNRSRIVPGTITSILAGHRPVIRTDGTPERDYLFIVDAVDAYLALAERVDRDPVRGRAFNFGTRTPVSVLDLVEAILVAAGARHLRPDVQGDGVPPGEIDRQYMDSTLSREVLGWSAATPLDAGLRATIDWFRAIAPGAGRAPRTPVEVG